MKLDWGHLKITIERALNSAQHEEHGSLRVHCHAAERALEKAKSSTAKTILDKVHHAGTAIELTKAVEYLREAQTLVAAEAPED